MSRDDLIRFARRDWVAVAHAKDQHWLRQKRTGSRDLCQVSDDLLRHWRDIRRGPSTSAERLEDLTVHGRVGLALRAITRSPR